MFGGLRVAHLAVQLRQCTRHAGVPVTYNAIPETPAEDLRAVSIISVLRNSY